jgi:hypothetical protein
MQRYHLISTIALFVILLHFPVHAVNAQDYYVDAINGSDNWTGTAQECSGCDPNIVGLAGPWKTLYQAFSFSNNPRFNPGDRILLKRGQDHIGGNGDNNSTSFLPTFGSTGATGSPITFGAYGGIEYDAAGDETNKPIVRARVTKTTPTEWLDSGTSGVWVLSRQTFATEYLWENDRPLKRASSLDCLKGIGSNCPDGNWYHVPFCSGCNWDDLHYRPTNGMPADAVHYARGFAGMDFHNVSHFVIRDLDFRTSVVPIRFRALIAPTNEITVEHCVFYGVFSGPWIDAINHDVSGLYVRYNKFLYTMRSVTNNGQAQPPLNVPHNIFDGEIAYNESRNTNGFDFWTGDQEHYYIQNMNRFHIHHNSIIGGRTAGIPGWYASGTGGTSYGNITEHNLIMNLHGKDGFVARGWSHGGGPYYDDCYDNIVRYNVIINNDAGMVPVGCFVDSKPPNQIYNNTLIGNGINIWGRNQMRTWVIKNNLSLNPVPTASEPRGLHFWYETLLPASIYLYPYTGDSNLYYPDGPAYFMVGANPYDFAGWKAKTGQDGNSFVADPVLANLAAGDFRLMPNSPAIDAGASFGIVTDFDGKSVLGVTDIGAYEFGARSTGESTAAGSLTGDFSATFVSDNTYESIREILFDLPGDGRDYSYIEHTWTFDAGGGGNLSFVVEAHHDANAEGDDFVFAYSTDGVVYTDMLTVTKTVDDDTVQSYALPPGLNGPLYVRVQDTDRTKKRVGLDALHIDQMYLESY